MRRRAGLLTRSGFLTRSGAIPALASLTLVFAAVTGLADPAPSEKLSPVDLGGAFRPDSLLADSTGISIVPDSLADSSGTFTAPGTGDPPSPVLDPKQWHDRLSTLRRRVHFDRRDEAACRELGTLLAPSRDIELRREAAVALKQALAIDHQDPDLWAQFARLQERRGFQKEAHDAYREALQLAPDRWDIWASVAGHEFMRYQRQFLVRHLDDAWRANQRALALKPDDIGSIRRAVRIAMLENNRAAVDSLTHRWEEVAPSDPWATLVRGMILADEGAWERADEAFTRGIAALPPSERGPFFRLDVLNPEAEQGRKDSPDRMRFVRDYWKWRDPTPADALNPRLIEHYRRMVEAELLFALESYHLHGWNHAPGEMLVRYGIPGYWSFRQGFSHMGDFYATITSPVASRMVEIPYGPFAMMIPFVDYNLNGRFYFPIYGWPREGEMDLAEHPTSYESPFVDSGEEEVEAWRFQDKNGEGRIEVAVALPYRSWPKELMDQPHRLATKLTVYDPEWKEADALIGSWAPFTVDALGRLVGRFETKGSVDSLIVGLETSDKEQTMRAAEFDELKPRRSRPDGPELSDMAFVSGVSFESPVGAYGWGYGSAIPNPGHRYRANDPIGIAFEAYGLHTDQGGEVRARIRISVSRQTKSGWLHISLGKKKGGEAELIFDASEAGPTLHQLLALELPPLDSGNYLLRVRVEDKVAGGEAEGTGVFEILSQGWKP
jgi:GWxTD domain-containing protein